ncbi:MAG: hypothetical protein ABI333_08635 [bacterium]
MRRETDFTTAPRWAAATGMLLLGACLGAACGDDDGQQNQNNTSQDAGPGEDGGPGQDGAVGSDGGGQDGGPACGNLLVETVPTASTIGAPGGGVPAPGASITIAETGVRVTRISDVDDPGADSSGYTNGYSRWSPANATGEYVTAFGTDGGAAVYRLSDRTVVASLNIGESNELHWDSSSAPGAATRLYYRAGAELRRLDVLTGMGNDALVHDFTAEYPTAQVVINGVEGAPSRDMRYWAFQVCAGMTGGGQCTGLMDVIVYDLQDDQVVGRLSAEESSIPTPNFVDMAPSGERIVVGSCKESGSTPAPWDGPYAWSRDFTSRVRLSTNCTHSGWAYGLAGEEYHVAFDSCGAANEEITPTCDYIMAVDVNDPQGWDNRIGVLYAGDLGWGNGNHIGRIYEPHIRGWFLMSTYTDSVDGWAANQLFFVELVAESAGPRLWRITPTVTAYDGYWAEAFASLDFGAQHVYWGGNWDGADNLELYQATLCDQWWDALNNL